MFYSETICSFYSYCVVIFISYSPLKEVLLYRNFQLGLGKVFVVRCPLYGGFLTKILYESNPFLKKMSTGRRCPLQRMSAIERFLDV